MTFIDLFLVYLSRDIESAEGKKRKTPPWIMLHVFSDTGANVVVGSFPLTVSI